VNIAPQIDHTNFTNLGYDTFLNQMTFESLLHYRRAHGFAERRWCPSGCLIYCILQQDRKCVRRYSCVCACECVHVCVNCVSFVLLDAYVYFKRLPHFWCRWYLLLYVVACMYICTYTHTHKHTHTHTHTCVYYFISFPPHSCVATHQPGSRTDQAQTTMRRR